jgi:hypothetical protein
LLLPIHRTEKTEHLLAEKATVLFREDCLAPLEQILRRFSLLKRFCGKVRDLTDRNNTGQKEFVVIDSTRQQRGRNFSLESISILFENGPLKTLGQVLLPGHEDQTMYRT